MASLNENPKNRGTSPDFRTTHWSVVLAAGDQHDPDSDQCLAILCRDYWFPVYCFIRKRGHDPEQSKDLTQDFFAQLLNKRRLAHADQSRGRFRSFLMTATENFLHNEHDRKAATKRGGGRADLSLDVERAEEKFKRATVVDHGPAQAYEKEWAQTLLSRVLRLLREEFLASGKKAFFDALAPHLWGEANSVPYAELAERFGITLVNVKVTAHRMRLRFREILRREIANTVASSSEVDGEIRHLMKVVSD
jgi:RNA polymerase sigma-70 factor (ECF subfamily)